MNIHIEKYLKYEFEIFDVFFNNVEKIIMSLI